MTARFFRVPSYPCMLVAILTPVLAWAQSAVHNPALSGGRVLILKDPVSTSTPVTINIGWPYGPAPTTGTLAVTVESGVDKIELLDHLGNPLSTTSWTENYPTSFKIKAQAASGSINDVKLNIQHDSGPVGSVQVTVVKAEFKENAPNQGFDSVITPRAIMVPKAESRKANLEVTPAAFVNQVSLSFPNATVATLTPSSATASPQEVTFTGVMEGSIIAKASHDGQTMVELTVDVKRRVEKTLTIFGVTEGNDDVQAINTNQGKPSALCIEPGVDGVLNSTTGGDDVYVMAGMTKNGINTGPNGICESDLSGDDPYWGGIVKGGGAPGAICVSAGPNGFRDTATPRGDDVISPSGLSITTGPDGICDTSAFNTNLVPTNVPTAAALQAYLNNTAWGKQANVHFTVTRSDITVNYDGDRNDQLKLADANGSSSEISTLLQATSGAGGDYKIFYVNWLHSSTSSAMAYPAINVAFVGDTHENSTENITAHEVGHLIGRFQHSNDTADLMYEDGMPANPARIRKGDWDDVNQ